MRGTVRARAVRHVSGGMALRDRTRASARSATVVMPAARKNNATMTTARVAFSTGPDCAVAMPAMQEITVAATRSSSTTRMRRATVTMKATVYLCLRDW